MFIKSDIYVFITDYIVLLKRVSSRLIGITFVKEVETDCFVVNKI